VVDIGDDDLAELQLRAAASSRRTTAGEGSNGGREDVEVQIQSATGIPAECSGALDDGTALCSPPRAGKGWDGMLSPCLCFVMSAHFARN